MNNCAVFWHLINPETGKMDLLLKLDILDCFSISMFFFSLQCCFSLNAHSSISIQMISASRIIIIVHDFLWWGPVSKFTGYTHTTKYICITTITTKRRSGRDLNGKRVICSLGIYEN